MFGFEECHCTVLFTCSDRATRLGNRSLIFVRQLYLPQLPGLTLDCFYVPVPLPNVCFRCKYRCNQHLCSILEAVIILIEFFDIIKVTLLTMFVHLCHQSSSDNLCNKSFNTFLFFPVAQTCPK